MQAIGRDRIQSRDDGTVVLSTPAEKGWRARLTGTQIDAEHPGTAIDTGDAMWEVVEAKPLPNGVRYLLAPWRDEHTIRELDRYDEESERVRAEKRRAAQRRESRGRIVFLLAIFVGHLPAHVQSDMESEYGLGATKMSLLSAFPLAFGSAALLVISMVKARMNEPSVIPAWLEPFLLFFLVESAIRLLFVVTQHRPLGSLIGSVIYRIYVMTGGAAVPVPIGQSFKSRIPTVATPEEIIARDRLKLHEPLLALLPAAEQRRIESTYDISLAEAGRTGAIAIGLVALLGLAISWPPVRNGMQFLSLLVAASLLVEQVIRLVTIARGSRAGSVLGICARPFTARYRG